MFQCVNNFNVYETCLDFKCVIGCSCLYMNMYRLTLCISVNVVNRLIVSTSLSPLKVANVAYDNKLYTQLCEVVHVYDHLHNVTKSSTP